MIQHTHSFQLCMLDFRFKKLLYEIVGTDLLPNIPVIENMKNQYIKTNTFVGMLNSVHTMLNVIESKKCISVIY